MVDIYDLDPLAIEAIHAAAGEVDRTPERAQAWVGLAMVLHAHSQREAAHTCYREALRRAPDDARTAYLQALVAQELGRSDEARTLLERSTALDPTYPPAQWHLGQLAGPGAGTYSGPEAEPSPDDPWMAEVLALRRGTRTELLAAVELLGQGQVERATALLEALRERAPTDTILLVQLHRAYRMSGQLDRALRLLEEARALDPSQDITHLHLAGVLREKARSGAADLDRSLLALALESAQQACGLNPTFAAAHGMRGDVLSDLERRDEAAAAWSEAARLDRSDVMWQEKAGQALCLLSRWNEAVPFLEQWDVLRPSTRQALLLWSAALANSGRIEEARVPMSRLRLLAPDDPFVLEAWQKLEAEWRAAAAGAR